MQLKRWLIAGSKILLAGEQLSIFWPKINLARPPAAEQQPRARRSPSASTLGLRRRMVRVVTGNEPTIHRQVAGDELLIVLAGKFGAGGGGGAVRVPAKKTRRSGLFRVGRRRR